MSTVKVNEIQDRTTSFSSTTAQLFSGRVKVWWNYAQRTGPAITNSYNVTSVTDNATGQYIVNFSVTLDKPVVQFQLLMMLMHLIIHIQTMLIYMQPILQHK